MIGRLLCWLGWHTYAGTMIEREIDRCLWIRFIPTRCKRCGKLEITKD